MLGCPSRWGWRSLRPALASALFVAALTGSVGSAEATGYTGPRGCPAAKAVPEEQTGNTVKVVFQNLLESDGANLYRVDSSGKELHLGQLKAGASEEKAAHPGSVLRVRSQQGHQLLLELKVPKGKDVVQAEIVDCTDSAWLAKHGRKGDAALAGCPLAALLSEEIVLGFHVICAVGDKEVERLCVFAHGRDRPQCTHSLRLRGGETVEHVIRSVFHHLGLQKRMPKAPSPALFTASGRKLHPKLTLEAVGLPGRRRAVVLLEGGEWHWPPIREGFVRPLHGVVHTGIEGVALRTLALRPRVFEVKSFILNDECTRMQDKAGPYLRKSGVSHKDADRGKEDTEWRTSYNYFLPSAGDPVLEALDERIQNLTRIPIVNSEYAQILRYDYWGRYTAHNDYFDPDHYRQDKTTLQLIGDGAYNRLLTVFMYMSDVEEGGETVFPQYKGVRAPVDFGDCTQGLRVRPERQKVIIFYNQHPDGSLDPHSLHGGCRVLNGTKWSANYWVWNTARDYKAGPEHRSMAVKLRRWGVEDDIAEETAFQAFVASLGEASKKPHGEL